jgi:hypothetical protein
MSTVRMTDTISYPAIIDGINAQFRETNKFMRSGIMKAQQFFPQGRAGMETQFPFWNADAGNSYSIGSSTSAMTPDKVTMSYGRAVIQGFGTAVEMENMTQMTTTDSIISLLLEKGKKTMETETQRRLLSTLKGITGHQTLLDNNVLDITGFLTERTRSIGSDIMIQVRNIFGDRGDPFTTLVMHSSVYAYLLQKDSTPFIKPSDMQPFATYHGLNVVTDDSLAPTINEDGVPVYQTYLFASGAIGFSDAIPHDNITSIKERAYVGVGTRTWDIRQLIVLHPGGCRYKGNALTDTSTFQDGVRKVDLENSNNWDIVLPYYQIPLIKIIHTCE